MTGWRCHFCSLPDSAARMDGARCLTGGGSGSQRGLWDFPCSPPACVIPSFPLLPQSQNATGIQCPHKDQCWRSSHVNLSFSENCRKLEWALEGLQVLDKWLENSPFEKTLRMKHGKMQRLCRTKGCYWKTWVSITRRETEAQVMWQCDTKWLSECYNVSQSEFSNFDLKREAREIISSTLA